MCRRLNCVPFLLISGVLYSCESVLKRLAASLKGVSFILVPFDGVSNDVLLGDSLFAIRDGLTHHA